MAKENLSRIRTHDNLDNRNCTLELLTDEGARVIYPFWVGWFETLRRATVVDLDGSLEYVP